MTETLIETRQDVTPGTVGDWVVDVQEYIAGQEPTTAGWLRVPGLTEITPPQIEKNLEDDGEINGDPWGSQLGTGISWTSEGTIKVPRATMVVPESHKLLRAAGRGVAEDGFIWVRFYKVNGDRSGDQGVADVTYTEQGGKKTDLTLAELTFTGRGRLDAITVGTDGASTIVEL